MVWLSFWEGIPLGQAQDAKAIAKARKDIAELQSKLRQSNDRSNQGAKLLLQLADLADQNGRPFTLIQAAKRFVVSNPDHDRHPEIMLKLIDAQLIAAREKAAISTARQFIVRHTEHPQIVGVHRQLASLLERDDKLSAAAQELALAYESPQGHLADAASAVQLYRREGSHRSFAEAARLAVRFLAEDTDSVTRTEAAWLAVDSASRSGDNGLILEIGQAVADSSVRFTDIQEVQFHRILASAYNSNRDLEPALDHYSKLIRMELLYGDFKRYFEIAHAMNESAAKMKPVYDLARKQSFTKSQMALIIGYQAYAAARGKQFRQAAMLALEGGKLDAQPHKLPRLYVRWAAEAKLDHAVIERDLNSIINGGGANPFYAHYALAFDLYRDRMKETGKAQEAVRRLINAVPTSSKDTVGAMNWLLSSAPSDAIFNEDANLIMSAAKQHARLDSYRDFFKEWVKSHRGDKKLRSRVQTVSRLAKELTSDPVVKLWASVAVGGNKSAQSRESLLETTLPDQVRDELLASLAYDFRHRLKAREKSVEYYSRLAKRKPNDFGVARAWIEAAHYYGSNDQRRDAARFALGQAPDKNDVNSWMLMLDACQRSKDPELGRDVYQWVLSSQSKFGEEQSKAKEFGDRLIDLGLAEEALAYWERSAFLDLDTSEALSCVSRWLENQEDSGRREALLNRCLEKITQNHLGYASRLADIKLNAGEWESFETTLIMARQLADEQLFVSSSVSESLALAWVKEIRGDAELPTVTKQRLLAIIESVGAGLGSGIARLSLIESGESIETVSTLDSQRETWEAVMWAGNHQHHWDQFMPFAQRFAKNGQHGRASALLTAMLQKIPRADSKRKKIARDLVAKMFTITSEFELDLDEGNPLAPLLRIGMLLQIGDRPAAVSQYMKQRKLFDERVKELPVSILLFAATIENETSSEAGWARSEDMLRLWLVHNNESQQATPEDQAAVQLLLAKTYFESGRYDIARSEYTTVLNQFPDTEAATDARFGVAQCYVEQKVFDKAEEIFTELRDSKLPEVNLRSEFMMGVMAIRQGDFDVAREMFQSVLERMPENALANETLYHLAEVFGIEQRFLDQLNMLRTIGRLGQQSKRWHTPGNSLFIVVHDSDLGISRGNSQIPVSITSDPGGDSEKVMLSSGSAGKGLFTAEIATVLAEATVDDGVLQITGADAIHVDYPEDFKKEFKTQLPQIEVIRIASDATFAAASRKIEAEKEETVTEQLSKEPEMIDEDLRKSVQRNASQIRPGNLIYLRVEDYDRDQGGDMDKVEVNLVASNGDKVTGELTETNPHSGVFEGTVPTAEMPAGATANGAAIDHEPLLAIDHDPDSKWMSEPDGDQGKWLAIDMKDAYPVDRAEFEFGNTAEELPGRIRLMGSHDGQFEYEVARYPLGQAYEPLVFGKGKAVVQKQSDWKYHDKGQDLGQGWRAAAYDDSAWPSGSGPLGYGDLGSIKPATEISFGEDSGKKHPTAYFRREFVYDPDEFGVASGLTVNVLSDDGFVLYLNGTEVARDNLPEGEVSFDTLTPGNRNSNEEDKYLEFSVSTAALREGKNTLAAEVHQPNGTSTDLGFDLELLVFSDKSPAGITRRLYQLKKGEKVADWEDAVKIAQTSAPTETTEVESLEWVPEPVDLKPKQIEKLSSLVIWSGQFIQRRPGAVRFSVNADVGGVMIGGHPVAMVGEEKSPITDVYLDAGMHPLTVIAWVADVESGVSCERVRENLAKTTVALAPFRLADFVLSEEERDEFKAATDSVTARGVELEWTETTLTARLSGWSLRHLKMVADEYPGNFVSVANVNITSNGATIIPPKEDVLQLAKNNILEIAAGDSITAVYMDALTEGGLQQNRQLEQTLQATFFNGAITPLSHEFRRQANGSVQTVDHELLRVEPGERIIVEVTDFDLDRTSAADKVPVSVQVNLGQALGLEAVETGPNTGVFRVEVETEHALAKRDEADGSAVAEPKKNRLKLKKGDRVYLRYTDQENTVPGHKHPRESVVFVNQPTEAKIRVLGTQLIPADLTKQGAKPGYQYSLSPFGSTNAVPVSVDVPLTVEVIDPDRAKTSGSRLQIELNVGDGRKALLECVLSAQFAGETPEEYSEPITAGQALVEGRFVGQMLLHLGDETSPDRIPITPETPGGLTGRIFAEEEDGDSDAEVRVLNLMGGEIVEAVYRDETRPDGGANALRSTGTLSSTGVMRITDSLYEEAVETLHVGERLFLMVEDKDQDVSAKQDQVIVTVKTTSGENEGVTLTETLTHSGIFTGSFPLIARSTPRPNSGDNGVECFFGDTLTVVYRDHVNSSNTAVDRRGEVSVAIGTDGLLAAFSKVFEDIDLAAQTRFHIAESYFELFKSQKKLERMEQAQENLDHGRRVLLELAEDFPDEKYAARVSYLLGQFAQEQEDWQEAIKSYRVIIRRFPDHALAPDAQYKMAQCHEEAGDFDQALEEYVAMAAIHPDSPLIPKVMIRINEYYYLKENYPVAARVSGKFIERFPDHELASRMAFRWGQCHYKQEAFDDAAARFEDFAKRYPDDPLCAEALFWAGESFRMDKDVPMAFRYYNRCRWDYPESEAAKYARGRLALPEMLAQFEREADLEDE